MEPGEGRAGSSSPGKGSLYPPPFLGPASHKDIHFYQDQNFHGGERISPVKSKKSLAEKMLRTLDKFTASTNGSPSSSDKRLARQYQYPTHYQQSSGGFNNYHPNYQTVRGPHGITYQYVYNSQPGFEFGVPGGMYEYGGHGYPTYEYPPSSHTTQNFCRCADVGKESVRHKNGPGSKCRRCGNIWMPPSFVTSKGSKEGVKQRPRLHQLSEQGSMGNTLSPGGPRRSPNQPNWDNRVSRGMSPPVGPSDPYDYIRRTRLKADEWDTYWDVGTPPTPRDDTDKKPKQRNSHNRKSSARQYKQDNLSQDVPQQTKDSNPTNPIVHRVIDQNDKGIINKDIGLGNVRKMATSNLMEDEENSQPESKSLLPSQGLRENIELEREAPNDNSSTTVSSKINISDSTTHDSDKSEYDKSTATDPALAEQSDESDESTADTDLSIALRADLASIKSNISVAEMRYRKFQRRNPLRKLSLQIEDIIVEEDEEALAREASDEGLPSICEHYTKEDSSSSDDELGIGKFKQVIGTSNLAEEILSEIYGTSLSASEDIDTTASRSMADEILDELYGEIKSSIKDDAEDLEEHEGNPLTDLSTESEEETYALGTLSPRTRLYRSISLQEKGQPLMSGQGKLSNLLLDTTRFKLSQRPSLLALQAEKTDLSLPHIPGTPTLSRPSHAFLKPFNSQEIDRINNVINNGDIEINSIDSDVSDSDFSDDEFDQNDTDYDKIPLVRPPPEGAEADSEYNVPELNDSFEKSTSELNSFELDISLDSSHIADISSDSLMFPKMVDTSFDRDSINSYDSELMYNGSLSNGHHLTGGSVIQNQGEKTIILSPALATQHDQSFKQEHNISISSSSWINIEGEKSEQILDTPDVTFRTELQQPMVISTVEPVKPPRLKKLARQQSKQEMLRAKGFGTKLSTEAPKTIKGLNHSLNKSRPDISSPILINSTLNPVDLESHKCISLQSSNTPFHLHNSKEENFSIYQPNSSDTDSSHYMDDYSIDEVYNNEVKASDIYNEHIYEEIPENKTQVRPLPPIPEGTLVHSIFTGATKYEILHYLNDARQRIERNMGDFDSEDTYGGDSNGFLGPRNTKHRVSAISNISDSSTSSGDSSSGDGGNILWRSSDLLEKLSPRTVEVERNDSGVGSDSGLSAGKTSSTLEGCNTCEDCDVTLPENKVTSGDSGPQICVKCVKRRGERKEIIMEIFDTEVRYGRDLRIIVEEFYRPMLVAGLLSSDQLASIFLNVEQLIQVNTSFTNQLKSELEQAEEADDDDLCSVSVGTLFIHAMPMLQAFEAYCTKQAASSMLLATMEKEKELLRVFLKVSQMENKILRRMNLSSFLMVPVQRVTKYPLLLARLLKVSPAHHPDRENIKEAQVRIESALEQINKDAKEIIAMKGGWRQRAVGGQTSNKNKGVGGVQREMNNLRVRKLSLELLGWEREETRFALEGRLTFAHIVDSANWRQKWGGVRGGASSTAGAMKLVTAHALLLVTSQPGTQAVVPPTHSSPEGNSSSIIFPKLNTFSAAVLLLVREKTSRFTTIRDPVFLEKTVICCEQDWDYEYFEIQEFGSKDSFVFKADDPNMTGTWFQALQFYSQSLGGWRKRRKGLANIMVDPGLS